MRTLPQRRNKNSAMKKLAVKILVALFGTLFVVSHWLRTGSLLNAVSDESSLVSMMDLALLRPALSSFSNQAKPKAPLHPRFQLAYNQSLGFFTDISERHWKQLQQIHKRSFPNHNKNLMEFSNGPTDKGKAEKLGNSHAWNAGNFQVEFHCAMSQRVPPTSEADGPKWVCDPHRLAEQEDCLIYSFGSNGKAEFEHGMIDAMGGKHNCEIHTFDIIKQNKRNGSLAKALEGSSTFHHWGLGTPEQASSQPNTFKTLQQTMDVLGHTNRRIDVFKIDCAWCEWFTFDQWLEQDIRQILVETHNAPMPQAQQFFQGLHDKGFVIFSKEANFQNAGGGVEFAFLQLSQDFFIDNTLYSSQNVDKGTTAQS